MPRGLTASDGACCFGDRKLVAADGPRAKDLSSEPPGARFHAHVPVRRLRTGSDPHPFGVIHVEFEYARNHRDRARAASTGVHGKSHGFRLLNEQSSAEAAWILHDPAAAPIFSEKKRGQLDRFARQ